MEWLKELAKETGKVREKVVAGGYSQETVKEVEDVWEQVNHDLENVDKYSSAEELLEWYVCEASLLRNAKYMKRKEDFIALVKGCVWVGGIFLFMYLAGGLIKTN